MEASAAPPLPRDGARRPRVLAGGGDAGARTKGGCRGRLALSSRQMAAATGGAGRGQGRADAGRIRDDRRRRWRRRPEATVADRDGPAWGRPPQEEGAGRPVAAAHRQPRPPRASSWRSHHRCSSSSESSPAQLSGEQTGLASGEEVAAGQRRCGDATSRIAAGVAGSRAGVAGSRVGQARSCRTGPPLRCCCAAPSSSCLPRLLPGR